MAKIVAATNAKIVLSSDWRYDWLTPNEHPSNAELRKVLCKHGLSVYDITPRVPLSFGHWNETRYEEIKNWIANNSHEEKIDSFVILEDYWDMYDFSDNMVHTNYRTGITDKDAEMAIEILNREMPTVFAD